MYVYSILLLFSVRKFPDYFLLSSQIILYY